VAEPAWESSGDQFADDEYAFGDKSHNSCEWDDSGHYYAAVAFWAEVVWTAGCGGYSESVTPETKGA
ncbi:MAG TPA: hypothetical protein VF214_00815, partial [Edaphobacter sp.]